MFGWEIENQDVPTYVFQAEPRKESITQKLSETKVSKLHQSQQPSIRPQKRRVLHRASVAIYPQAIEPWGIQQNQLNDFG